MNNLKKMYEEKVRPELQEKFKYASIMQVPRFEKITLNMGVGEAAADKKAIEGAVSDLLAISGQKPVVCLARKSVAGFKIRQGWPIGVKVTLRNKRMYEFLERFIWLAIPRINDFRGFSPKSFDGQGNYSLGIKEQFAFTELHFDQVDKVRGLDVCITTSARNNEEGQALLEAIGFPLKK
ncbi:MAG: 50S ribosomal protein L5 [Pseudomonadota bacterium]